MYLILVLILIHIIMESFLKQKVVDQKINGVPMEEVFGSIMRASRERQNRKGQVGKHNRYHQADE
jgi:hypothetical protein